ncbi:voltage-gated potassium channel subunit beta-1 isoform X1 [Arapaima gigas]
MLAARSSSVAGRGGHEEPPRLRRQSVASLGSGRNTRSAQETNRENRSNSSVQQGHQRARKAALIRELETNWYLQLFGLSREETTAQRTGMPYRASKTGVGQQPAHAPTPPGPLLAMPQILF